MRILSRFGLVGLLAGLSLMHAEQDDSARDVGLLRTGPNPLGMRTYEQTFTVVYDSEEAANAAELVITPLPDSKEWAFSARWDDNLENNIRVHDLMAKYGYKGTFYLNSENHRTKDGRFEWGTEYTDTLLAEDFSLGGHSMTHAYFNNIPRNVIWWEMLAIRVERESSTDKPIASFAFPGGVFESKEDPLLSKDVAEAFLRTGYHHTPYAWFLKEQYGLSPKMLSSCVQVRPGDRDTTVEEFDKWVDKYTHEPWVKNLHPNMTLGIHAWMNDDAWDDMEAALKKYAHRDDWWYCNQNEFAAYRYEFQYSQLEKAGQDGNKVTYRITRFLPVDLGDTIPLSFKADGAVGVFGDTAEPSLKTIASIPHITLEHDSGKQVPTVISAYVNDDNLADPTDKMDSGSDVQAWLQYLPAVNQLALRLTNTSPHPATDIHAYFRLPLCYAEGVISLELGSIKAGESLERRIELPDIRSEERFLSGKQYFVAELDFNLGETYERVFATTMAELSQHVSQR